MVSHLKLKHIIPSSIFVAVSAVVLALTIFSSAGAAGNASFSLSPASGQFYVNDTFSVRITENSGSEGVNAVEADLTYDKNVLQFVGIDASDSAFTIAAPTTTGGGVVNIPRAIPSVSLTGSQTVASVTFKVIGTGNTAINFAGSSAIVKTSGTQNIWNGATGGGSYSLINRPVAPPATGGGGTSTTPPPSTGSGSTGSSTKPSAGTTKPSGGSSSAPTTGGNSSSTTPSSGGQPSSAAQADPGVITTTEGDGNSYFVAIKVLDENGKPVVGASVKLDNQQLSKTDAEGVAGFLSVKNGNHTVSVTYSGVSKVQSIAVKTPDPNAKAENIQSFDVKLAGLNEKSSWGLYVILTGIAAAALLAVFIMPRHHKLLVDSSVELPDAAAVIGKPVAHTPGELIHPSNQQPESTIPPDDNTKPQG